MPNQVPDVNTSQGNQTNSGEHGAEDIWTLTFWAIGILLDPLLIYTFFLGDDRKCVQVDKNFGTVICVVHFVFDIINIIFYAQSFDLKIKWPPKSGHVLRICGAIICMLPLSLEMLILILATKTRTVWYGGVPLLLQFLPRVIRLLILAAEALPLSTFGRWTLMFFYSYVFFGQVIGAFWYLQAINTDGRCWQKACRTHNSGCPDREFRDLFFRCNESSEAYKIMNDFCSRNTTEYDFGVFRDAHQSGILEMRGFSVKILYCFRWAMQTISGFGSNLETATTDVIGNIFVLIIIYTAVILFYFLIGQMQNAVQRPRQKERNKRS